MAEMKKNLKKLKKRCNSPEKLFLLQCPVHCLSTRISSVGMFGYFCQWQGLTWPLQYSAYLEVWGIMKMLKGPVGSVSKTVFDFCRPPTSRWNFSKFAKLVHGWIDCEVKVRILTETNNSSAGDGVATLALWPFIGDKKYQFTAFFFRLEGLGFQVPESDMEWLEMLTEPWDMVNVYQHTKHKWYEHHMKCHNIFQ